MTSHIRLQGRQKLTFNIDLYDGSHIQQAVAKQSETPDLIILATWINAKPSHMAKLLDHYLESYPNTPILHLTTTVTHFLSSETSKTKALESACKVVLSLLEEKPTAQILIHAFSNGGGSRVALLAKRFAETQHRPLPIMALILDSLPGTLRLIQDTSTLSQGLPQSLPVKVPLQMLAGAFVAAFYAIPQQVGYKLQPWLLREYLNDERYVPTTAKRLYIYSSKDEVVFSDDVELHIKDAQQKDMDVSVLKFEDSPHVMHLRMHPDEYWAFIKKKSNRTAKL